MIEKGVTSYVEVMEIAQSIIQASDICTPVDSQGKKRKNDKPQSQPQVPVNHTKMPNRQEYGGPSRMGPPRSGPPRTNYNHSIECSKELKDGGYD